MSFSGRLEQYSQERFKDKESFFGDRRGDIAAFFEHLTGDELILMRYLYGTLPLNDLIDCPPSTMLSYVQHALLLRKVHLWTSQLPEDLFIHYVLCPRVNNEQIVDCRPIFSHELEPIIEGLDEFHAILETNYWCAERVSYRSTDNRTLDPLGMLNIGFGRCGEESTFLVTALRSIGIAARQVYTPWWSHCDDNHAWVEVYLNGNWHYLGACEPEEKLDCGWFTQAATRAILVHTRLFSDYSSGNIDTSSCVGDEGCTYLENITNRYAQTKSITVQVIDNDYHPVANALVTFSVLNMAVYRPIAMLMSDTRGQVRIALGVGSVRISASRKRDYGDAIINVSEQQICTITLRPQLSNNKKEDMWDSINFSSSHEYGTACDKKIIDPLIVKRGQKRKLSADQLHSKRLKNFTEQLTREPFKSLIEKYPKTQALFLKAGKNAYEVADFLEVDDETDRFDLLSTLSDKDFADLTSTTLEDHLANSRIIRRQCFDGILKGVVESARIFKYYVLCPRIEFESLTPYRSWINAYLNNRQKKDFKEMPKLIWRYILTQIQQAGNESSSRLSLSPRGTVECHRGTILSKKLLFVAICRTLGIPARLNSETSDVEYFDGHAFTTPGEQKDLLSMKLKLDISQMNSAVYFADWGVERFVQTSDSTNWVYNALDLRGLSKNGNVIEITIPKTLCRVITTVRLPNGDQQSFERIVRPAEQEDSLVQMRWRSPEFDELLERVPLNDFYLYNSSGIRVAFSSIMDRKITLLAFLFPGEEPTMHVLNELESKIKQYNEQNINIIIVVQNIGDVNKIAMLLGSFALHNITIFTDNSKQQQTLARHMYVDPDRRPLVLLVQQSYSSIIGLYAFSGYNVGNVRLILRLARLADKSER